MQRIDLKKKVLEAFHHLPPELQKIPILLAVSAGKDSSVLANIALQLREQLPPLHWVHVNYHLRRPDSDEEERFLKRWAHREKIPFHVKRFYPKEKPKNLQAWARERRYAYFSQVISQLKEKKGVVWLAHHRQDQAETIIERLIRGAGLKGLSGMASFEISTPLYLFRPLLEIPPSAISEYIRIFHVKFLEDRSNVGTEYLRNRIRHQILPLLLKENPKILNVLDAFGQKARETTQTMEILARSWIVKNKKLRRGVESLPVPCLKKLPQALLAVVCEKYIKGHYHQEYLALSKILPQVLGFIRNPKAELMIPLKGKKQIHLDKQSLFLEITKN